MHKSSWHPPGKPPDLLHWPGPPKPCQGMPTSVPGWFLQPVAGASSIPPLGPWGWRFFAPIGILVIFCPLWAAGTPDWCLAGPWGWVALGLWGICCCPRSKWAPKPQHARCGMGAKTPFSCFRGVEILNVLCSPQTGMNRVVRHGQPSHPSLG